MNKEAVLIITTIATIIVGAIQTLTGNGFISDVVAGKATDIVNSLANLLVLLAPVIAGIIARPQVFSKATTQIVADQAAATGNPTINVTPP